MRTWIPVFTCLWMLVSIIKKKQEVNLKRSCYPKGTIGPRANSCTFQVMWYLHHILATQSSQKNAPAKKKTAWTEKHGCFVFGSSSDDFSSFWRDVFSGSSRSWSSWVSMIFHQTWLLTHLGLVGFTLIFPTLKTAKGLQTPGLALLPNRAIPLVFSRLFGG